MMLGFVKLSICLLLGTSIARKIYEFPNATYTGIENIGITSNGELLIDTITAPHTYLLDPTASNPTAQLLATYPDATSCLGIAEVEHNIFAIVVGNYTTATFEGVQGSFSIWSLDITDPGDPVTRLVTAIPEAEALNGMTAVEGSPGLILVADSSLGVAWGVNVTSGAYTQAIQDPLFAKTADFPLGINGLHALDGTLYFTNSALSLYGKVGITSEGTATGPAVKIVNDIPGGNTYDDFALDCMGNAFIANHPDAITEVTYSGSQFTIANSSMYVQPTSAIFATGLGAACTLYVVTDGHATSDSIVSGQVFSLDVC